MIGEDVMRNLKIGDKIYIKPSLSSLEYLIIDGKEIYDSPTIYTVEDIFICNVFNTYQNILKEWKICRICKGTVKLSDVKRVVCLGTPGGFPIAFAQDRIADLFDEIMEDFS